jgi:two-component system, NtrC family, response regulator HydG
LDEELITKSLLKLLKKEGYEAVVARGGNEAPGLLKAQDFDLIISDVRMPETDGIETIIQIRRHLDKENKKHIPEGLITGYAHANKYLTAKNLEAFDYLYKPFDDQEFLRIVRNAIGQPCQHKS